MLNKTEKLIKAHHVHLLALEMSGWPDVLLGAKLLDDWAGSVVFPDQKTTFTTYFDDLVGEKPPKLPLPSSYLKSGALYEYGERYDSAMNAYVQAPDRESISIVTSPEDLICGAAKKGMHCKVAGKIGGERDRILRIQNAIERFSLGPIKVFNLDDYDNCYALLTFGVLRAFINRAINLAELDGKKYNESPILSLGDYTFR